MIAEQAQCVDFCLGAGDGPRLDLELRSGQVISRLVDIKRSGSNSVMSINELSNQDEIEFQLHDCDDSPGVLLKKDGNVIWTPIAARTRSRVHFKDNNYTN